MTFTTAQQPTTDAPVCAAGFVHRGVHSDRLDACQSWHNNRRETTFALAWEKENAMTGGLRICSDRDSRALLELMLIKDVTFTPLAHQEYLAPYTQHSAEIAATVIQWLGTNVGFHWLERTLKEAGYTVTKDT